MGENLPPRTPPHRSAVCVVARAVSVRGQVPHEGKAVGRGVEAVKGERASRANRPRIVAVTPMPPFIAAVGKSRAG